MRNNNEKKYYKKGGLSVFACWCQQPFVFLSRKLRERKKT